MSFEFQKDDFKIYGNRVKIELWMKSWEMEQVFKTQELAKKVPKLLSKLDMMEKSFEMINNDRNAILSIKQQLMKEIEKCDTMSESWSPSKREVKFLLQKILNQED